MGRYTWSFHLSPGVPVSGGVAIGESRGCTSPYPPAKDPGRERRQRRQALDGCSCKVADYTLAEVTDLIAAARQPRPMLPVRVVILLLSTAGKGNCYGIRPPPAG